MQARRQTKQWLHNVVSGCEENEASVEPGLRGSLKEGLLEERCVGKEQAPVETESCLSGRTLHQ